MKALVLLFVFIAGCAASNCSHGTSAPTWYPTWYPTTRPNRPENGSCNFDDRPCSRFMRQDTNDDFDWSYNSYSTPSYDTGPSGDHTTGHGRYLYAEASSPRRHTDRARMTAYVRTQYHSCFYFHYHMYGSSMGTLRVYVNNRLAWELSGNQGNQWIKATIPIRSTGMVRLDFDAVVGWSYRSDTALDDLGYQEFQSMSLDDCMVTPSCASPPTPTYPFTTSPPYPPYTTSPPYPPYTTSPPIANFTCGRRQVPTSRVIGGVDARPGYWPWQVGLYYYGTFMCGGSLISPEWVVTAAHCILYSRMTYDVVAGDHNNNVTEGWEQTVRSSRIIVHPNWNTSSIDADIALIKLSRPVVLNSHVQPVCLPRRDERPPTGKSCYITGWGKIRHPGNSHHILQQAELPVVSNYQCQKKLDNDSNFYGLNITNNMICGGVEGSIKSGCHGDSGGPYVCRDWFTGRWVLQGAVSWGSPQCNALARFTVFSRVARFRDWIDYQVRHNRK